MNLRISIVLFMILMAGTASGQGTENVILVTLDGLRWEEVFTGADPWLLDHEDEVGDATRVREQFDAETASERRQRLMPFLWGTIARRGQLYGNRHLGSRVDVSNDQVFSYPSYNEILTGYVDPAIDSNDKIPNSNVTLLEWLNRRPEFEGQVAAFGSWDVFPYIINEPRSGVPVNAGFEAATGDLSERERYLNELQTQTPSPWETVRLDVFTHHFALEYMKRKRPRVLFIAYGETDDFAHDDDYSQYLDSAHRTDGFIRDLWTWVQSDDEYRDRTSIMITVDHGRGSEDRWVGHGIDWIGSRSIWLAIMGPNTPARGEIMNGPQIWQNQVAATAAALLGLEYQNTTMPGDVIRSAIR